MHIPIGDTEASAVHFQNVRWRMAAPSLHEIQAENADQYPGAQLFVDRVQIGQPANESFEEARRWQWKQSIQTRTARYLEGLPDRCQSCLSTIAMNLAVSVVNGSMSDVQALDAMGQRRRLATSLHRINQDPLEMPETGKAPPFCQFGSFLLPRRPRHD